MAFHFATDAAINFTTWKLSKLPALGNVSIKNYDVPISVLALASIEIFTLASIGYWIKKPRKSILSNQEIALHKQMLPNTTGKTIEELGDDVIRPHMVRYSKKKMAAFEEGKTIDIILVGSGLGSLTVASLLSQKGYKCLVLEQHDQSGGCLHTFESAQPRGYEFDVGLHYVGGYVGDKWSSTRKVFDAVTGGGVEWNKLDGCYDRALNTRQNDTVTLGKKETWETFDFTGDYDETLKGLVARFPDKADKKSIEKFYGNLDFAQLRIVGWIVSKVLSPFFRRILSPILLFPARNVLGASTYDVMKKKWNASDKVIGVLNYLYGDYGLPPSKGSFAICNMIFNHWKGGAFYPMGGSSALAIGACAVIRKHGGECFVNARTDKIIIENGRATGVKLANGREVFAKMVVSDVGARGTFMSLLDDVDRKLVRNQEFIEDLKRDQDLNRAGSQFQDLGGMSPSCSIMTLFLGLDDTADSLDIPATNAWCVPGWDHDANFKKFLASDNGRDPNTGEEVAFPACFIGSNSAKDKSYAERYGNKVGTVMVLCPVNYHWFDQHNWKDGRVHARGDNYEAFKKDWEDRMLRTLFELYPKTRGRIVYSELGSPLSNNHYLGVRHGEVYGLTHTPERMYKYSSDLGCQTDIKGLYLTGQDVASAGICGALIGGILTTASISKKAILGHIHNLV